MKKLFILPVALLVMSSCGSGATKTEAIVENEVKTESVEAFDDGHNARNSLSYHGKYKGVIPAADCPGIEIEISIPDDSTYTMTSLYIDHADSKETVSGKYTWNRAGSTIILLGVKEAPSQFFVAEGRLIMRDIEGNEITGELADNYVLPQIENLEK